MYTDMILVRSSDAEDPLVSGSLYPKEHSNQQTSDTVFHSLTAVSEKNAKESVGFVEQ
jgi:hypothetical protein